MPMPIEPIRADMNDYEMSDALLLAPFSHADTFEKRIAELRRQDRHEEADIVTERFGHRLTAKARREDDRITAAVIAWAKSIEEES